MKSYQHVLFILLSLVGVLWLTSYVNGHNFTPNEDASFHSLMDDLKGIILLIRANVDNPTLVTEYANNASSLLKSSTMKEINEKNQRLGKYLYSSIIDLRNVSKGNTEDRTNTIDEITEEIILARIDKSELENATVQSLVISLDLNKIFDYYSKAFHITDSKMNMSTHNLMGKMNVENTTIASNLTTNVTHNRITDTESYKHALSLTNVTIDRFNKEVNNSLDSIKDIDYLESGFIALRTKLYEKGSINDISGIIHGQIQPAFQDIFNLGLE